MNDTPETLTVEYAEAYERGVQAAADEVWKSITKGPFGWPTWVFSHLPYGGMSKAWRSDAQVNYHRF